MNRNHIFKYLAIAFANAEERKFSSKEARDIAKLIATMTNLELATARECIESVFEVMREAEEYEEETKAFEKEDFYYDASAENN